MATYDQSRDRYFVIRNGTEEKVSADEFISAERQCGFRPKDGCGPFATSGFSRGTVSGRIEHYFEGAAQVRDLEMPGSPAVFSSCEAAYDYARSNNRYQGRTRFIVQPSEAGKNAA